ncbi:unnamed protein product [Mycena citricolor]|uniref:Uncharacterized protein n=1 Tax=Mycena citricolor TaxID=2018698 RepID=A0AAD2K765_9AGAR|nr:unnamed protein product [Mycena citricolor]
MRTSVPLASRTSLIPRQWVTCIGAIAGPIVTESKPSRPWQNTTGFLGERSTLELEVLLNKSNSNAHRLWINSCSWRKLSARSSSVSMDSTLSLFSVWNHHRARVESERPGGDSDFERVWNERERNERDAKLPRKIQWDESGSSIRHCLRGRRTRCKVLSLMKWAALNERGGLKAQGGGKAHERG